ncbi:MAG: hypothetical protein IJS96_08555, partial [Schwartzia sp.]|nr:hypothetical protein [Schwartzia sp. (in: firmicutes)]
EAPYGSLFWRESAARAVAFCDADIGLGCAVSEFFSVFADHIITRHIIAQIEHNVKSRNKKDAEFASFLALRAI